jgi:predicted dehydrogenase
MRPPNLRHRKIPTEKPMPSSQRRIGIIGAGFGAQVHAPGFASEGWDVAAISSRSREKAEKAARAAGIPDVHTDPMELIRRGDLTAVAITTPPGSHRDLCLAALNAGKHVLCEKPFAIDSAQAAEMRDAAEKAGRTAMINHEFRHTPQRAYIKDLLRDGAIGRFRLCTVELFLDRYVLAQPRALTWMASKTEGGGVLGALGSHYIDALRHWFGEVASVSAWLATLRPELVDMATGAAAIAETDDTYLFSLDFKNGGTATMVASFAATPPRGTRIVVMGDNGTLIAEQPGPNPEENGVVVASRNGASLQPLKTPDKYLQLADSRDHRLMAFRMLVRDFTRGIEQGVSPAPNFTDGLRCQEVLDAVRKSSETGRRVELN